MIKIRLCALKDNALDWAVELARGTHWSDNGYFVFHRPARHDKNPEWRYSTSWAQCGALIDELKMEVRHYSKAPKEFQFGARRNQDGFGPTVCRGPTYQVAICRCYVLAKIGQFVDIPEELI